MNGLYIIAATESTRNRNILRNMTDRHQTLQIFYFSHFTSSVKNDVI